ncbi:AlpA family phage regulatory protein [Duganella radicis]|uniref:AlpA family phage regulatory protein n=1 Tax=Duganella radicis TaxID=551988 RepID=A0A6L6PG70_9BURK|nr:AlpA family phage regulatory protein [Duganella radicis]MTV38040.1 AlpA family phage regulatory protein [Duganella radicis]
MVKLTVPSPALPNCLRAKQIAGPILPISLSTWWAGVKSGRYPQPIKLGPRTTVWRRDEILALFDESSGAGAGKH